MRASVTQPNFKRMRLARKIKRAVTFPVFPLFSPWVAGRHRTGAVREAVAVNKRGGKALINYLGEHYKDPLFVQEAKKEYHRLVWELAKAKKSNQNLVVAISIKPSQFGFDVIGLQAQSRKKTFQNMREIVEHARRHGIEVEIDMEHSNYTDFTLDTFKKLLSEFKGGLRVCLQANLQRTEQDLLELVRFAQELGVRVGIRLVKGVYPEIQNLKAFHKDEEIIENFKRLVRIAFENSGNLGIAIGTHRLDIFNLANRLSKETRTKYEPQMLKGIALKLKRERYKDRENKLTVYVPYGEDAVEYGSRRAKKFLKLLFYGSLHWVGKGK